MKDLLFYFLYYFFLFLRVVLNYVIAKITQMNISGIQLLMKKVKVFSVNILIEKKREIQMVWPLNCQCYKYTYFKNKIGKFLRIFRHIKSVVLIKHYCFHVSNSNFLISKVKITIVSNFFYSHCTILCVLRCDITKHIL